MRIDIDEPCPLPDDPVLAEAAIALRDTDDWGQIFDTSWRRVYSTDQERLSYEGSRRMAAIVVGEHVFSPESVSVMAEARFSMTTPEAWRSFFVGLGGLVLADTPGGKQELRELVHPWLRDVVDELSPIDATVHAFSIASEGLHGPQQLGLKAVRIRDDLGKPRGTVLLSKLATPMSLLSLMAFERDPAHLQRTFAMSSAKRRAGAVLFADLENSSTLSRTLSTASYFALVRRIVSVADQCIVDAGGVVGRHVGDGVVAFFPAESYDSESSAARGCISAARAVRSAITEVARESDLPTDAVVLRFGLHWGATLYMGSITTTARAEVTALGDEANEAARIEASATGGRMLASKQLVERLDVADAAALDLDPDRLAYVRLADLDTATDKAHRDAPAIAVCDV